MGWLILALVFLAGVFLGPKVRGLAARATGGRD